MQYNSNPNDRLQRYLGEGTEELRSFVTQNIIAHNPREIDRITKYYLFWNFYEGRHYRDFNDAMISFNYIKAFIDKVNLFLLGGKAFSFKVTTYGSDVVEEKLEASVENLMLKNWRKNKHSVISQELLQMGSVCGDVWIGINWWEERNCCKIIVYDSRVCFPEFEGGDVDKMSSFTIRQPLLKNDEGHRVKVTKYTKEYVETWIQSNTDEKIDSKGRVNYNKEPTSIGFIPIVHIKNRPLSSGYYGLSDAHDILKLNKVFNELNQELKSIIDYHATPTTVVTGATVKNMKRGIGKVWSGLPPEANVFNLGLDVDLTSVTNYLDKLKTSMHEIADVPEGVLGKIQSISGTSAAALKLTYQPLVQQADLKALTYGEGIASINEMILKFYSVYAPDDKDFKKIPQDFIDDYRCEPVFAYGFPTDRMSLLQEAQIESQLGLASKKELMNRLGKNNVPDLLKQIEQDKIDDATLQQFVQQLSTPPMSDLGDEGGGDLGVQQ